MKKVLSIMLIMALLFPMCGSFSGSRAVEAPSGSPISTVEEFENMDASGVYYLANDIDFSGKTYTKNVYGKSFKGVLNGNGHALLGIQIDAQNSDAGIFATSFGGTLTNLVIGTNDDPVSITSTGSGYSVAAIAGTVVAGANFDGITIYANVKGDGKTAGFTSYMPNGKLTITDCKVYGSVSGNPAAGFVTMANNGSSNIEITYSENYATVTAKNLSAGGFYSTHADVGSSRVCHLTIKGCANYGAITASDWRVGGIVGEFNEEKSSSLNIEYCYNMGAVTMTGGGGFAAGIVGGMCFDAPTGARRIANVYNAGLIRNTDNSTRAYAIAFAHSKGNNVTVENAAYLDGVATENTVNTAVEQASDKTSLLSLVSKYPDGGEGLSFIADVGLINDGYPILAAQNLSHENIQTYSCGRQVCLDCDAILSLPENENHSYVNTTTAPEGYLDGYITSVCKHCSDSKVTVDEPSQHHVKPIFDNYYVLTRPEHLMWYSANQNAGLLTGNETICLGADIDMKGYAFTPIASQNKGFTGVFEGEGHTISNLVIDVVGEAGLFAKLGLGAQIKNLALNSVTVRATGAAGAVAGSATVGSVVVLENISVINSEVTSSNDVAGGLVGTSSSAVEVRIDCAVSDNVTVTGTSAGGILGVGNSALLLNAYANAKLTATSGKTGALATHTSSFSATYCGYSKSTTANQKDGTAYDESAFASGEIAYMINTFGAVRQFGLVDGKTSVSDNPVKMVRLGSKKVYTNNALSPKNGTAVYAIDTDRGMTLVFVQVPNAPERLVDSKITVNGKDLPFSDLTLCKYVASGDSYFVAAGGCIMYTVQIEGSTVPSVTINGAAETVE